MNNSDLIYFVIIAIFIVASLAIQYYSDGKRKKMLTAQAEKRNGEVTGGFLRSPTLVFQNRGIDVRIYSRSGGRNSPPHTYTQAILNGGASEFSIHPNSVFQKLGRMLGRQRIETMNEEFDRAYEVRGEDESQIRQMIDTNIQQALMSLDHVSVKVTPSEFKFSVARYLRDDVEYDAFIETALALLNKI